MPAHNDLVGRLVEDILLQTHRLGLWSYVFLGLLVMVEGPIATILGGAAAASGALSPSLVFVSAFTGNLCGDLLWYLLGSRGKSEWISRHAKWLRVEPSAVDRLADGMRENAPRIVFIGKLTLFFMIPILLAAGITRADIRRWLPADACAELLWSGMLVACGFYLARYLTGVERIVQVISAIGFCVCLLAAMAWLRRFGTSWASQST